MLKMLAVVLVLMGVYGLGVYVGYDWGQDSPVPPEAEVTFTAYKVDVNEALAERFTDAQVECVVLLAEVGDARVLLAGPCVTTYP